MLEPPHGGGLGELCDHAERDHAYGVIASSNSLSISICARFCCSAEPSIKKVSSTRSPSVVIFASCRLMWCRASTRAIAYSRPERSLVDTPSSQRCARSSGRKVTRGVIGNDLTRRDKRPRLG